jgi:hypothetical protein
MGYSTTYTIKQVDGDVAAFRREFSKHKQAKEDGYHWFGVEVESEEWKWYEHEKHISDAMVASECNLVILHGEGEEQGDVWDKEFRRASGGKVTVKKFKYRLVREEKPSE